MTKERLEVLWRVFEEAAPHISNLWWMRKLLVQLEAEAQDVESISKKLEQVREEIDDITKRTDISIFLNYLSRRGKPSPF